jgi:RNA polymerase subunit RPABC4/transcription elongation factor Spt4
MSLPTLDTIIAYTTICFTIFGALLAALWISLIIWTFRDMRSRSRDPFAQILAALVVALLPIVGLIVYLILRPPETLAEAYERALEEEALLQEIEERPACPGCSRTVDSHWILCPHCHTRLRKLCADCNSLMDLHWTLCPHCGNDHVDLYYFETELLAEPLDEDLEHVHDLPYLVDDKGLSDGHEDGYESVGQAVTEESDSQINSEESEGEAELLDDSDEQPETRAESVAIDGPDDEN